MRDIVCIKNRLLTAKRASGLSFTEIGNLAGCSRSQAQKICSPKAGNLTDFVTFSNICSALKLDPTFALSGKLSAYTNAIDDLSEYEKDMFLYLLSRCAKKTVMRQ